MNTERESWASLIRRKRDERELLQAALAQLVGTTQPTVSAWERGAGHPSPAMQARLIEALDITPEDLHAAVTGGVAA